MTEKARATAQVTCADPDNRGGASRRDPKAGVFSALTEWGQKTPRLDSTERRSLRALVHLGPAALYLVALFVGGLIPDGGPPGGMSDKTLHAMAFGLFVPFAGWAARFVGPNASLRRKVVLAAAASSTAGALLEYWQAFVPYRDADVLD